MYVGCSVTGLSVGFLDGWYVRRLFRSWHVCRLFSYWIVGGLPGRLVSRFRRDFGGRFQGRRICEANWGLPGSIVSTGSVSSTVGPQAAVVISNTPFLPQGKTSCRDITIWQPNLATWSLAVLLVSVAE